MTAPISAEVIAKLRTLRKIKQISGQTLADRMTQLGYPIARVAISKMETGRRDEVSVDLVAAAAQALGTTIVALLNEPVACPQCKGEPPIGFTCNTCGSGVRS
jgi:transcriptional regulator with XRE-family HTH domain